MRETENYRYLTIKISSSFLSNILKSYTKSKKTISIRAYIEPRCAICLGPRTEEKVLVCPNCLEVYHISCLQEYKKSGWDGTCLKCHYPIGDLLEKREYMSMLEKLDLEE